jgi:xanthine/uracil/vitamin C permease (AzgA family)
MNRGSRWRFHPIRAIGKYDLAEKVGFWGLVIGTSLTFAIDQGMLYGFVGYIVMKWLTRKQADISAFLYLTTVILVVGKIVAVFFVDAT